MGGCVCGNACVGLNMRASVFVIVCVVAAVVLSPLIFRHCYFHRRVPINTVLFLIKTCFSFCLLIFSRNIVKRTAESPVVAT